MASADLTPGQAVTSLDGGGSNGRRQSAPLILRPADLVELAEQVYRGFFGAGLLVSSIATGYAIGLGMLQPAGQRVAGITVCSLLLLGQLLALHKRRRFYALLRSRPGLMLLLAAAIGAGAWAAGVHNEQMFYVLAFLIGVVGAAVPLRTVILASLIAAAGMAAPHIADGTWTIGVAVAAGILPPLFWLILEQFARFMLRLHQPHERVPRHPKRVQVWGEGSAFARPGPGSNVADADPPLVSATQTANPRHADLTARQLEVLLLCAEGLKHEEIGDCLQIGAVQAGRHLRNARKRADVATNAELVAWAIERGLLLPMSRWQQPPTI